MPALSDRLAPYEATGFRPARPSGLWSAMATVVCDATPDPIPAADTWPDRTDEEEGRAREARRAILDHLAGLEPSAPGGAEVIALDAYRLRRAV